MKTYQQMNAIIQFAYKAQEIAKKYIEHNKKNQSEKDYDYYNEELLHELVYFNQLINDA